MQIDTKYFLITCLLCHFLMLHKQILQKNYYWPKTLISQSQANNVKQTKMDRSMHTTDSQRLFPTSLSELHTQLLLFYMNNEEGKIVAITP